MFNTKDFLFTAETTPDDIPTLPRDLTIEQVVEQGRQNGFSDASIRAVLLKRKNPQQNRRYSAAEVNEAMQIDLEKNEVLPAAIQNIEGGVEKGRQLLREVNAQIESFKNTSSGVSFMYDNVGRSELLIISSNVTLS